MTVRLTLPIGLLMVLIATLPIQRVWPDQPVASGADTHVTVLAAGTRVEDSVDTTQKWNRVVLVATPRIASGSIDSLSASIRDAVASFSLTIMAAVDRGEDGYRLRDVGIGYSLPIDGKRVVVDPDRAASLGANLGFIQRQVLRQNQSQLESAKIVVRSSTLVIFDTPAILLRDRRHVTRLLRHLVWVDTRGGGVSLAVWWLDRDTQAARLRVIADDPLTIVAGGTLEDRAIHVDGDQFFLGIPTEQAFALQSLPPGTTIDWTVELKVVAAAATYDQDTLAELATRINRLRLSATDR